MALSRSNTPRTMANYYCRSTATGNSSIENFCEAYHLPWIHPSLNTYSPLEKHDNLFVSKDFAGQSTTCYNLNHAQCEPFPRFENWP